jgi:hypothetical protein
MWAIGGVDIQGDGQVVDDVGFGWIFSLTALPCESASGRAYIEKDLDQHKYQHALHVHGSHIPKPSLSTALVLACTGHYRQHIGDHQRHRK